MKVLPAWRYQPRAPSGREDWVQVRRGPLGPRKRTPAAKGKWPPLCCRETPSCVHSPLVLLPGQRASTKSSAKSRQGRIWHPEATVQHLGRMPTDPHCNMSAEMRE